MIDKTKPYGFASIPKDLMELSQRLISSDKLCKLLFVTNKNAIQAPDLTTEEKEKLITDEYIQIVPKVKINEENKLQNYIVINFDNFSLSDNPMYFDDMIIVDILCSMENWKLINKYGEVTLRPYEIAQEIMLKIDNSKLSGIGQISFINGEQVTLADDTSYSGLTLKFVYTQSKYVSDKRRNSIFED